MEKRIEIVAKNLEQINKEIGDRSIFIDESNSKIEVLDIEKIDLEHRLTAIEEKIQHEEQGERKLERDIADLKELLSNLIIMQSRLAGREKELDGALSLLSGSPPVSHVASNQDTISSAAAEILSAAQRIRSKV